MDVSSLSSGDAVLSIYQNGIRSQMDNAEKLAKIEMELKLKNDSLELAEEVLIDFFG